MNGNQQQRILAWIPIRKPVPDHWNNLQPYFERRDKFLEQLRDVLPTLDRNLAVERAELCDPPDYVLDWLKPQNFLVGTRFTECMVLEAVVTLEDGWLRGSPGMNEEWMLAGAVSVLTNRMNLALLLTELAYPGWIDTLEGVCTSGNELLMHINSKSTYRHMAYPEDGDPLWPPVESFDLGTVVTWAKQTSLENGPLAQTRIERALAAYSHLIGVTWLSSGEVLFRAMQGLEAFYCEGVGDLRRQLSEKSRLWLGPWDDRRNIVGQLYDLRSAFVHGSASLTYKGHESRAWETDEQEMFKFDAGVKLATRLLIATLQRCVKENVFDVNWSYAYTTRASQVGQ